MLTKEGQSLTPSRGGREPDRHQGWLLSLGTLLLAVLFLPTLCVAESLVFYGVLLDDESRTHDEKLAAYLTDEVRFMQQQETGNKASLSKIHVSPLSYDVAIQKLSSDKQPFLARATPYVYVAAEMLGAKMTVLGVYESKAGKGLTYNSYIVVNRAAFDEHNLRPTLGDLVKFLRIRSDGTRPAKFIYHSQFSTSSYFLPSLFFHASGIYAIDERKGEKKMMIRISSELQKGGSTDLVKSVANGNADFAATWDGTRTKFIVDEETDMPGKHYDEYGDKVYFIKLPETLPNDLLVASSTLDAETTNRIRAALRKMTKEDLDVGDFVRWQDIETPHKEYRDKARAARLALSNLRKQSRTRTSAVTIQIEAKSGTEDDIVEAVRQTLYLSGTEFVEFDEESGALPDFKWTLEPIHDGALLITSSIRSVKEIKDQHFQVSFDTTDGLMERVGELIHARMHRIRYTWPYHKKPVVLRDVAFSLPEDHEVRVQRIKWIDMESNQYSIEDGFPARVEHSDPFQFKLVDDFDPEFRKFNDPLNNYSYRVILVRPSEERLIFFILTIFYVLLVVLAAGFAVWGLARE